MSEQDGSFRHRMLPLDPQQAMRLTSLASDDTAILLQQMVAEQAKTNELLALLIEALGEAQGMDEDSSPFTYMDGTPCR